MTDGGPQRPDAENALPSAAPQESPGPPSTSISSGWTDEAASKPRASCVKHFDALWFCYCASHHAWPMTHPASRSKARRHESLNF